MNKLYEISPLSKNKSEVFLLTRHKKLMTRAEKLFEGTSAECEAFVYEQSRAGPKRKLENPKRCGFILPAETVEKAKKIGNGNASEGVRIAVGEYKQN